MTRRWLLVLPPVAQLGALLIWVLAWPHSSLTGLRAQIAALVIALVCYGVLGIQRFRFLRRTHADIKRKRVEQAHAFQAFVDEHLRRP